MQHGNVFQYSFFILFREIFFYNFFFLHMFFNLLFKMSITLSFFFFFKRGIF